MTDQDKPSPEQSKTSPESNTAAKPSTTEEGTNSQKSTDGAATYETKPKTGEVKADDTKRFLAEVVAYHGISKAVDRITATIQDVEPGGILIVEDLSFAINDIIYLDMCSKLRMLSKWTENVVNQCQEFFEQQKEPIPEGERIKGPPESVFLGILSLVSPVISGLGTLSIGSALAGITEGLKAFGDIVGYFRADYEIKGQTLGAVDDLYIQALLAEKLRAKKRDVYLLNFNFINQSKWITDLSLLLERKLEMLAKVEMIKSVYVDSRQAQVQALETHLAGLRAKLIEYLVKVDEDIIETLRKEIDQTTNQLTEVQQHRMPDSQITALETYLSGIRAKLVDELIKDTIGARAAIEAEIKKIIQMLEDNEKSSPGKKLSDTQVKALNDQLKLYQTRLVELLVSTGNNTKETLRQEIERVSNLLKEYQKIRLPDSQITAMETHLASLKAKFVECLIKNDNDVKAGLEKEINGTIQLIEISRKDMRKASGIVNGSAKVNDAVDAFITSVTTVPTGGAYPPLVIACVREYLAGETIRYILKIKLISSGADFIIEKPPIYRTNVNTSYIGGGVVSYVMAEKDGKIVASGTVADIAAIDHTMGKEPKSIKWKIQTE